MCQQSNYLCQYQIILKVRIGYLLLFILKVYFTSAQSLYDNDACKDAFPIYGDTTIAGRFELMSLDTSYCPSSYTLIEKGIWFAYTGKNDVVNLELMQNNNNLYLRVYKGSCDSLICDDQFQFQNFFAKKDEHYFIYLYGTADGSNGENYSLILDAELSFSGDFCHSPITTQCGDSIKIPLHLLTNDIFDDSLNTEILNYSAWIEIEGQGGNVSLSWDDSKISDLIFNFKNENDCEFGAFTNIIRKTDRIDFSTIAGKKYLISIGTPHHMDDTLILHVDCVENEYENICSRAIEIDCDSIFHRTMEIDLFNDYLVNRESGYWFKIPGDGLQHQLAIAGNHLVNYIYADVFYAGDTSNNGACNQLIRYLNTRIFNDTFGTVTINAPTQGNLYIKIGVNTGGTFSVRNKCNNIADQNYTCMSATGIECSDTITLYYVDPLVHTTCGTQNGRWFSMGKFKNIGFKVLSGKGDFELNVYKGQCDSLHCISTTQGYFEQNKFVYIHSDSLNEYFINLSLLSSFENNVDLMVYCDTLPQWNANCDQAIQLRCNKIEYIDKINDLEVDLINNNQFSDNVYWYEFSGNEFISHFKSEKAINYELFTGGCDSLIPVNLKLYEQSVFKAIPGEHYYLRVKNLGVPFISNYFFTDCFLPDENDECEGAVLLECDNDTIQVFSKGASPGNNLNDCIGNLPEKWFKIIGNGKMINIFAPIVAVYRGSCGNQECLGMAYDAYGFIAEENVDYLIATTSGNLSYTVLVSCGNPPDNFICEQPQPLACEDEYHLDFSSALSLTDDFGLYRTLWYALQGDGLTYVIPFSGPYDVFEDSCKGAVLKQVKFDDNVTDRIIINTAVGKDYLIALKGLYFDTLSFQVSCLSTPVGINCAMPANISCGDTLDYHTLGRNGSQNEYRQSWYKIEGNNGWKEIQLVQSNGIQIPKVNIYKAINDCDSLILVADLSFDEVYSHFSYFDSNEYYLEVYIKEEQITESNFAFVLTCKNEGPAFLCESAQQVVCDSNYIVDVKQAPPTVLGACTLAEKSNWFSLKGDGNYWSLSFGNLIKSFQLASIYIGEGSCDSMICLKSYLIDLSSDSISLITEEGKNYYFKIVPDQNRVSLGAGFTATCRPYFDNNECNKAMEIHCGELLKGNTFLAQDGLEGTCGKREKALYYRYKADGDYMRLEFDQLGQKKVELSIAEKDCINGKCLLVTKIGSTDVPIIIDTKKNVEYYIVISASDDVYFQMSLSCYSPNENQNCFNAEFPLCGDTLFCALQTPLGFVLTNKCSDTQNTVQNWFQLPQNDSLFELVIGNKMADNFEIHLVEGECGDYKCLHSYDGNEEKIVFFASPTSPHYLNVIGKHDAQGSINIALNCALPVSNDLCLAAINIECNEVVEAKLDYALNNNFTGDLCEMDDLVDVWYSISGDSMGHQLYAVGAAFNGIIEVFAGTCDLLKCMERRSVVNGYFAPINFIAQQDSIYYIRVAGDNQGTLNFSTNCFQPPVNDNCSGALQLVMDGITSIDLKNMTNDDLGQICGPAASKGAWYHFKGNGKGLKFSAGLNKAIDYSLFSGDCNTLTCISHGSLMNGQPFEFHTDSGKDYLIIFYLRAGSSSTDFSIISSVISSPNHDECEGSKKMDCGSTILFNNSELTPDVPPLTNCSTDFPDNIWFNYTGDGNIFTFKYNNPETGGSIRILDDCTSSCYFQSDFYASLTTEFSFSTVKEKYYLFNIGVNQLPENKKVKIETSCTEGYTNTTRKDALPLECRKYEFDFTKAKSNLINECGNNAQMVQLFYSFKGNGSKLRIIGKPNPGAFFKIIDENCLTVHEFSFAGEFFNTVANKLYYFVVVYNQGINQTIQNLEVVYQCPDGVNDVLVDTNPLKAIPNPFSNTTKLVLKDIKGPLSKLRIFSMDGRAVYNKNWIRPESVDEVIIDQKYNLAPGAYKVEVVTNAQTYNLILIKTE